MKVLSEVDPRQSRQSALEQIPYKWSLLNLQLNERAQTAGLSIDGLAWDWEEGRFWWRGEREEGGEFIYV